ncbi:hypothetical protein QAD02_001370 [Eretmocerus hayati]|uniref:Uncharacterized protein n=1 Tax=Eretmocerus hayati TaxID=131215 RepID=A0ACC2NGS2_9HYME|nr:hypothetical protein QAD02_001370 [Eretmocerus hayati]
MSTGKECISCRDVLWILVFWGFGVNYMLRNNLNLAIVTMTVPRSHSAAASECVQEESHNLSNFSLAPSLNLTTTIAPTLSTNPTLTSDVLSVRTGRYQWDEYQQSLALAGYYWLHWVLQVPGGLLARKYGTKIVFGMGNLLVAFLGFLIPAATHYSLNALIFLRVLQGFIAGIVWPSMHDMTAKWIPPTERSRFVSAYLGSSVGAAITYPLCALITDSLGWEAVFHITSAIGIIWWAFWAFLVYDSPRLHPRISELEKNYILKSLMASSEDNAKKRSKKVPWRSILTSGPFWVTIMAHWGGVWGFVTLMTQAPSYFNYVQGWNIHATGWLSGSPHIARMAFSYTFSVLSDWLLQSKRASVTGVRKIANFVCCGGQGLLTLGLSLSGCEPIYAAVFMIAGTAVNGAVSSGTIPAFVDLSPNYASVLFGICNLVTSPAGFVSPLVVGLLTNGNQTIGQWRIVFLISAANLGFSCIVHLIWGTSIEQSWNNYSTKDDQEGEEKSVEGEELLMIKTNDSDAKVKETESNESEKHAN